MKNTNDLYFFVNIKDKQILEEPKPLELNWKNISGLSFLTDKELSDLSWAGYEEFGFIKFDPNHKELIKEYSFDENRLLKFKSKLKEKLNKERIKYERQGVLVNNQYIIKLDYESKLSLTMKYLYCLANQNMSFEWETSSGEIEFTSLEFIKLFNSIMDFIQKTINIKINFSKKINSCATILELSSIDFSSIKWNSNQLTL